ncbi:baseplate J/gp47 family protein [Pseudomonas aeruginosa]|uniref:baseplate J/gp47 family protein n=1 Tax=Pseudomonas aeruginosa TaxID=287 RepID=UPI00193B2564|nr:baseplate J/gp47 family protein [Pseudomonas aeruginosa]MBM2631718.1 baseplate J/gp47 family protein [Pseudomonas aeruginosa]MBM2644393.1 baseplate J/gp47 family protein [Pseudomonas aeruginosa]MBM2690248.1 baseplate J/gp47 family protein [Pseudomonas aeruginosa]MBM2696700.1 baseplate J/gp47 family protein [Pseudomonas aeruginosa]MBM2703106.1 baseplate J/gp47 family protein [Pseudomonas aeruginosa]
MLIPGLNQLAEPEIVKVEQFETLLEEFKAETLAYIQERDPEKATRVAESLENDGELLSLLLQAMTVRLQTHERRYNARIKQMLAWWAEGSNLDARLADMGLERRVINPGNPNAFPPVPAEEESDADARIRYYLAPHAPAAGSRLQYRREAMTLGERATVTVEAPTANQVVVTYTFGADSMAAKVKDANGRQSAPGQVAVTVLARAGDGTPSAALLDAVRRHFARDDVRPETDLVTVQAAEIVRYRIRAVVYINNGPDAALTKGQAEAALAAYAAARHILEGYVDPSRIDYVLHAAGAERLELLEPLAPIECTASQAPYCEGVEIEVRTL